MYIIPQMNFFEYPNIAIPGFLESWDDHSWHNDICPNAQKALTPTSDYPRLRCWVEADARDEREYPDQGKFTLEYLQDETDDTCNVLYSGEDAVECEKQAVIALAKIQIVYDERVPGSVADFSELHNYVDANGYGGAFENSAHSVGDVDFWNSVQEALDIWIKTGGLVGLRNA
jgi:hypothetical protein